MHKLLNTHNSKIHQDFTKKRKANRCLFAFLFFFPVLLHNKSDNATKETEKETSNCPESVVVSPFIAHCGFVIDDVFADEISHGIPQKSKGCFLSDNHALLMSDKNPYTTEKSNDEIQHQKIRKRLSNRTRKSLVSFPCLFCAP